MTLPIKKHFHLVSKKNSFKIITALVTHFDLQLHQMDVQTVFLNGNLEEEKYMTLLEGLQADSEGNIVCKLKRSIYELKQASRQCYLEFNDTITSFGFKENLVDR